MTKYYITIIDTKTGLTNNLVRTENNIDETIVKEFGEWNNLHYASTGGRNVHPESYQMAGTTKDGSKAFSILCVIID